MSKIIGIGNAIVDILSKVEDEFLHVHHFEKSSMALIDETMDQKLTESVNPEKVTSGGSAGNTIAAISELGGKTTFIGKVGDDEFGKKFISEIEKTGAEFSSNDFHNSASAKSFIFVTPDAHRTMCTYLGCASQITEEDIKEEDFKDAKILYLEGYLWDAPETILALKKAIKLAKENDVKVAFTLSDSFCVVRHKEDFLNLIKNDLDIVFANEAEFLEVSGNEEFNLDNAIKFFSQNQNLTAFVTRSEKGCIAIKDKNAIEIAGQKVNNLVDTTGAGDAFAAGSLYGLANGKTLEESAKLGNILASKIIQQFGARFEEDVKSLLK